MMKPPDISTALHELKRAQARFLSGLGWKACSVVKGMGPILWWPPIMFAQEESEVRWFHTEQAIEQTNFYCKDEWYDAEDKYCVDNNLEPAPNQGDL